MTAGSFRKPCLLDLPEHFNGFKHDELVTRLIDYIFISKNDKFKVKKYAIQSNSKDLKYPLDHLPVYVNLKYN
jgi:exonuclease III